MVKKKTHTRIGYWWSHVKPLSFRGGPGRNRPRSDNKRSEVPRLPRDSPSPPGPPPTPCVLQKSVQRGLGRARRGLPEKGRSGGTPGVPRRPGGEGRPGPALTCSGASGAGRHQGAAQAEPRGPEQQPPRPHCPGAPRARRGRGGAARGGWPAARRLGQRARSLEGGRAGRQSARLWAGRGGSASLAAPVGKTGPGGAGGGGARERRAGKGAPRWPVCASARPPPARGPSAVAGPAGARCSSLLLSRFGPPAPRGEPE